MPNDLDKLQGTWNVTALEVGGKQTDPPGDARIIIRKDRFESLGMGGTYEGTIEIDETRTASILSGSG